MPLESVRLTGGFWANRQDTNGGSLRHGYKMLEQVGTLTISGGSRIEAGPLSWPSGVPGSDVYKWLEAVAYELQAIPIQRYDSRPTKSSTCRCRAGKRRLPDTYYQLVEPITVGTTSTWT